MNLHRLRCFVLAAEELHFGHAAQKLDILPSAFGRFIRLLEEDLGAKLFVRTTRNVVLTEEGEQLLGDARKLLAQADAVQNRFREKARRRATKLRIGAIDSAAAGLIPMLLNDFSDRIEPSPGAAKEGLDREHRGSAADRAGSAVAPA